MNSVEKRLRLRAALAARECLVPASIYDVISAQVAQAAGYQIAVLTGSAAARAILGAPDLVLLSMSELADHIRRITRASELALIVDADHGYGNALNAMRTVEELEHSGVAALSIEDTVLPRRYGQQAGSVEVISMEEMLGKLRAAVQARRDPQLVIAGRTSALRAEGLERTIARFKAYAATGIDAIFTVGLEKRSDLAAIHAAITLPIIVAPPPRSLTIQELATHGVRALLPGHQPLAAATRALQDAYAHLARGAAPEDLKPKLASAADMERLTQSERYRHWQREYL